MPSSKYICIAAVCVLFLGPASFGSATFQAAVTYGVGTNPQAAVVGDFNSDGKLDVIVLNYGDSSVGNMGGISILLGNGDGTLQNAQNLAMGNTPSAIYALDVNGDGRLDLIVTDSSGLGVALGNGDGTFQSLTYIAGIGYRSFAVADFDRDGKVDLAISDANNNLAILLGNGDGTFQTPKTVPGILVEWVEAEDFNGDGNADLTVVSFSPINTTTKTLKIMLGNGDGTFQSANSLGTCGGFCGFSLAGVGDLNQDGRLDLVVSKPASCWNQAGTLVPCGGTAIFLGAGSGSFTPAGSLGIGELGSPAAIADFDGDGKLDAGFGILADTKGVICSSNCLYLMLGNGDGSFKSAVTLPLTAKPVWVLSADLNSDTAPDLVSVNSDNTISVLINSGTDFSLKASAFSPANIGAGQSATATLSLSLLNSFNNPVALSCSVQPAQAGAPTCSISPGSITFDSAGHATAQLTVTAGALARLQPERLNPTGMKSLALAFLPVGGLAFVGIRRNVKRAWNTTARIAIVSTAICVLMLIAVSCGGGGGSTINGGRSYTITVNASSEFMQHSTTLTLSVQ